MGEFVPPCVSEVAITCSVGSHKTEAWMCAAGVRERPVTYLGLCADPREPHHQPNVQIIRHCVSKALDIVVAVGDHLWRASQLTMCVHADAMSDG